MGLEMDSRPYTVLPRQWRLGSLGQVVGTEREVRWEISFEIPK